MEWSKGPESAPLVVDALCARAPGAAYKVFTD